MLTAVAIFMSVAQTPVRPRDPWVFRAIFEDRPRQLIIGLGSWATEPPLWIAFNPETGIARKVWRGQVDLRGKVHDFSQENSRPIGTILESANEDLGALPNKIESGDWKTTGLNFDDGWRFAPGAKIESPLIDPGDAQKVYVSFDEFGNKGRLLFRVLRPNGEVVQYFNSSSSGLGDNSWQWNYKLLEPTGGPFRLEVSQADDKEQKRIRNLKVFCDPPGWYLDGKPAKVRFRGYSTSTIGNTVAVLMEIEGAGEVGWIPELTHGGWSETFTAYDLPPGAKLEWRRRPGDPNSLVITSKTNAGKRLFRGNK